MIQKYRLKQLCGRIIEYTMKRKLNNFIDANIVKFISYGPFVFIPSVIFLVAFMVIYYNEIQYQKTSEAIQSEFTKSKESQVISSVEMAIELIEYQVSISEETLKEKVKNRVQSVYSVAKNLYDQHHKNHTKSEMQKMIIDSLRPLIWNDKKSFIFILDFEGTFFLAPEYLRHLEGSSIINFKDATGRYVIKEEIELAKLYGEGFLWDAFTRPGYDPSKQYKQLAFVKRFDDYDWYLGSAEYIDTTVKEMRQNALNILKNAKFGAHQYFFVMDRSGKLLMHGQDERLESKNILDIKDFQGKEFINDALSAAKKPYDHWISYQWMNPNTHTIEEKFSFIKEVPSTDWIIGSGYYKSDIAAAVAQKRQELHKDYKRELSNITLLAIVLMLLSLVVSFWISRILQAKLSNYTDALNAKTFELLKLNESLENQVKSRTVELEEAYKNMKEIAITDSLTKIYNRYYFHDALKNEIFRAQRYNSTFSLCMFDIDHFKNINDTYGHDVGDIVLETLPKIIKPLLRESDIFARIGGEEFIILFPKTTQDEATDIARRIQSAVFHHNFLVVKQLTISLGVVAYKQDSTIEDMLKRVDIALYAAKDAGRNCVMSL